MMARSSFRSTVAEHMNVKKALLFAALSALTAALVFSEAGVLSIGNVSITVLMVPVILATITLGLPEGVIVALIFGAGTMAVAAGYPPGSVDYLFTNPAISVVPRLLIPVVAYLMLRLARRLADDNTLSAEIICSAFAAITGVLANTFFVFDALAFFEPQALGVAGAASADLSLVARVFGSNIVWVVIEISACTAAVVLLEPLCRKFLGTSAPAQKAPVEKTFQKWLLLFVILTFFFTLVLVFTAQSSALENASSQGSVSNEVNEMSVLILFGSVALFASIFVIVSVLVRHNVVGKIQDVNRSLGEIQKGNLDEIVKVDSNTEFVELSAGINSTVDALKGFIAEAEARIDRELELARVIQSSSLPSVFPPYPDRTDFDIFASMDPAKEVGGDFYDLYLIDSNRLAFLVADVSGKGITAAMFMMKAKATLKACLEREADVATAMTKANAVLVEGNDAELFVTCWMGVLNFAEGRITFANAGHNPPLLRRAGGEFEQFKTRPNLMLGLRDTVKYRLGEVDFNTGDEIFLYTDGVTEAVNEADEFYGEDRLLAVLNSLEGASAQALCEAVKTDVDEFAGEADQFDDITLLGLRLARPNRITLVPDEDSIVAAEEFVECVLENADVPMKIAVKINIAVDEIYSNVVRYSGAEYAEIECRVTDDRVSLAFVDNGKPYNPLEKDDPDLDAGAEERQFGGFGIYMVKKTMDGVEYLYDYRYKGGRNVLTLWKNR